MRRRGIQCRYLPDRCSRKTTDAYVGPAKTVEICCALVSNSTAISRQWQLVRLLPSADVSAAGPSTCIEACDGKVRVCVDLEQSALNLRVDAD